MKLNLRLHTYHLHYVFGQRALASAPFLLEVDLPHPGEGTINLPPTPHLLYTHATVSLINLL